MKFLFLGAGAIGTYIGGSLALAGQQVSFIERREAAEFISHNGLRLKLKDNERHIEQPVIYTDLSEALAQGPYDAAAIAVKSYDTHSVLAPLASYPKNQIPPVICFQNGVENEAIIRNLLGEHNVISATVTSAIGRRAVGNIVLEKLRGVGIAAGHSLSLQLLTVLQEAGLNARIYDNPEGMKWSKMLTNLMANASAAILNMTPAEIFSHPFGFRIEREQLREALRVMDALKFPVMDLPGTPVRPMTWLVRWFPNWLCQSILQRGVAGGRGGKMPSFHIDLYSGSGKSEVDYLNGAVKRFGTLVGIATPVNQILNQTLLALTSGELEKDSFERQPEKLWKLIKEHS
jgi:2-dehydropantoate 2-reductase